jgi:hypothetical protein
MLIRRLSWSPPGTGEAARGFLYIVGLNARGMVDCQKQGERPRKRYQHHGAALLLMRDTLKYAGHV